MALNTQRDVKYVYDLPYLERMELCRILDQNDKWEELGGVYMDFDVMTIHMLRREILRGYSPTEGLLEKWGHKNHTVLELFVLLSKMQHYQAMLVIKKFVDPEYHKLIYEGEENLSRYSVKKQGSTIVPTAQHTNNPGTSHTSEGDGAQNRTTLHSARNTLGVTQHNMNVTESSNELPPKLSFINRRSPACGKTEEKIINVETPTIGSNHGSNEQTVLMNQEDNIALVENPCAPLDMRVLNVSPLPDNKSPSPVERERRVSNLSDASSLAESVGTLPHIRFKELEMATNGWDPHTILGKGGFGTVYKGTWKNTQVAIKRTRNSDSDESHTVQIQQILGELKMLNSYRHDNILPLYGFSIGGEDPCLIYQYMPNGSLEDRLQCRHGTKPLNWFQRHSIATGTARGLQFLHTIGEKPLIHGDIKSANILLDSNFEPRIGDFGLAKEGPYSHYTHMKVSRVHGTRPYLPDEFLRAKKFSTKVDTYSFGIVLFELATGLRAYDEQRSNKFLKDHVENCDECHIDSLMDEKAGPDELQTFVNLISLGRSCISKRPKDRPEMVFVLQKLDSMALTRDMVARAQTMLCQNPVNFHPSNPIEIQLLYDHLSHQRKLSSTVPPSSSNLALFRAISPQPSTLPLAEHIQIPFPNGNIHKSPSPIQNHNNPFLTTELATENNHCNFSTRENSENYQDILIHQTNGSNFGNNLAFIPSTVPLKERKYSNETPALFLNQNNVEEKSWNSVKTNAEVNLRNQILENSPIISVSPPSAPHKTGLTSTTSYESEIFPTPGSRDSLESEPIDSQDNYSFSNAVLPLISELGIKVNENKEQDLKKTSASPNAIPEGSRNTHSDVSPAAKTKIPWILGNSSS